MATLEKLSSTVMEAMRQHLLWQSIDSTKRLVSGLIHAEEAETSLALALGQRVLMEKASRDAFDRGKTVRERGYAWSRHAKYDATFKGGFVNPPMDLIDEISQS